MPKKIIVPTILFAVVLVFSFGILSKNKGNSKPGNQQAEQSQIVLFYGIGCPHCATVEEYIKENKIEEKISFIQKEVYYDRGNADELAEKVKICGIPESYVGVPFLWDGKKCFIGDVDIINFFKEKISR